MINIHKNLFYDVFNKNFDLYDDFIKVIKKEYTKCINDLDKSTNVLEIRNNVHKIVGIISNLLSTKCDELLYLCKLLLFTKKTESIDIYLPYVKNIIEYDKTIIGL